MAYSSSTYFTPKRKKSANCDTPSVHKRPERTQGADLSSRIDLRLPRVLALSEHGSSHDLVPVLLADQIRGLEEDRRAVVPRHCLPLLLCGKRAVNSSSNCRLISLMISAEMFGVVVRHGLFGEVASLDLHAKCSFAMGRAVMNTKADVLAAH